MMIGKVKTNVLPEPVKAIPIMSRPCNLQSKIDSSCELTNHLHKITYTKHNSFQSVPFD